MQLHASDCYGDDRVGTIDITAGLTRCDCRACVTMALIVLYRGQVCQAHDGSPCLHVTSLGEVRPGREFSPGSAPVTSELHQPLRDANDVGGGLVIYVLIRAGRV